MARFYKLLLLTSSIFCEDASVESESLPKAAMLKQQAAGMIHTINRAASVFLIFLFSTIEGISL